MKNDLVGSDEDDIEEELRELDLNSGNKETNIVEVYYFYIERNGVRVWV